MPAAERIIASCVIEQGRLESLDRVTGLATGVRELPTVWIGVTVHATLEFDTDELKIRGARPGLRTSSRQMTRDASHAGVPPGEWIVGRAVIEAVGRAPGCHEIEAVGRAPGCHEVAREAPITFELPAMRVLVAGHATRLEPEIGPIESLAPGTQPGRVRNVRSLMTAATVDPRVCALQHVSGFAMCEPARALLAPPDQLELRAVVLDVALPAILIVMPRMESLPAVDSVSQQSVTGQTAFRRHTVLTIVTLETVPAAVDLCVRRTEFTRGDLRRAGPCGQHGHDHEPQEQPATTYCKTSEGRGPHLPGSHP